VGKVATANAWIVEEFAYLEEPEEETTPSWEFNEDETRCENAPRAENSASAPAPVISDVRIDEMAAEAEQRGFAAGREQGREEGRTQEQDRQRAAQAAEIRAAEEKLKLERARLIASLDEARQRYFHAIEPETVRLSLAIAARILRREAQMDSLLLSGAVRVALGQLAASTRVRLKVPAADLQLWTEAIALIPNPGARPEVIAGEGMLLGDCVIETELGSVDLGIRAQLNEIERGFFDRPGSPSGARSGTQPGLHSLPEASA
jgi:flagellar biosynthesis/type III secretory pathway protein FliH